MENWCFVYHIQIDFTHIQNRKSILSLSLCSIYFPSTNHIISNSANEKEIIYPFWLIVSNLSNHHKHIWHRIMFQSHIKFTTRIIVSVRLSIILVINQRRKNIIQILILVEMSDLNIWMISLRNGMENSRHGIHR